MPIVEHIPRGNRPGPKPTPVQCDTHTEVKPKFEIGMTWKRYTHLTECERFANKCKEELPKVKQYLEDIYDMSESDEDAGLNGDGINKSAITGFNLVKSLLEEDE